jgi:hypothetical protein
MIKLAMSVADEQSLAHELIQMADADQRMRTAAARGEPWVE